MIQSCIAAARPFPKLLLYRSHFYSIPTLRRYKLNAINLSHNYSSRPTYSLQRIFAIQSLYPRLCPFVSHRTLNPIHDQPPAQHPTHHIPPSPSPTQPHSHTNTSATTTPLVPTPLSLSLALPGTCPATLNAASRTPRRHVASLVPWYAANAATELANILGHGTNKDNQSVFLTIVAKAKPFRGTCFLACAEDCPAADGIGGGVSESAALSVCGRGGITRDAIHFLYSSRETHSYAHVYAMCVVSGIFFLPALLDVHIGMAGIVGRFSSSCLDIHHPSPHYTNLIPPPLSTHILHTTLHYTRPSHPTSAHTRRAAPPLHATATRSYMTHAPQRTRH